MSSKAEQYRDALGALVQSFVNAFGGTKGVREVIQKSNAPRSPIQDVMNQERALRMGVREIPTVPGQAPKILKLSQIQCVNDSARLWTPLTFLVTKVPKVSSEWI